MFNALGDKLQDVFKRLRGQAALSETNIADAMRDIRLALLAADVNLKVVKEFIEKIREDCLGQAVLRSVSPGQQVVKIVNDRLVELMGDSEAGLDIASKPSVIMLVGLHGGGKTTSAAKLASRLKKERKKVMLAAADVYRPAAIDQLEILGREIDVPVYSERGNGNVPQIAANALAEAKYEHMDVLIVDTAGRLQIDESMVRELVLTSQAVRSDEILLVADAALGQEAVAVADHFHRALGLTGVILTKLDGDARGGAALSIRSVTGCPIKFVGTGEKITDLEVFYPDRMASRILGMGDVVSLVEKAATEIDEEEARRLHQRMQKNKFDFNDFLGQLKQIASLGGAESILKLLPGGRDLGKTTEQLDPKNLSRIEAMILSMTPGERANPDIIDFSRRKRIARGSGNPIERVSGVINQFNQMRKMMRKPGMLRNLMGAFGGGSPEAQLAMPAGMGDFGYSSDNGGISARERQRKKQLAKLKKQQKKKQRRKKK